jgi:hypothetical protein
MNLDNITDIEVDGIDMSDYPDFCDAFIATAFWKDTGVELSEAELDELNDNHGEFVYDHVIKRIY